MSLTTPDPPPPPGDEEQAPDISFESGSGDAGGAADTSADTPATDEDVNPDAAAPEPPD